MDKHIVTSYDNDLEYIKILIIEMGVLLEKQTFEAIELIKLHNLKITPTIKETEKKINSAEKRISIFYYLQKKGISIATIKSKFSIISVSYTHLTLPTTPYV